MSTAEERSESLRISVKGAVLGGDDILLVQYRSSTGLPHFNLPGGRIRPDEPLRVGLARKVHEETGVTSAVGRLLLCLEYIPEQHNGRFGDLHKLQYWFECEAARVQEPCIPRPSSEPRQIGAAWYPLAELPTLNLLPPISRRLLRSLDRGGPDLLVARW